jgi:hypothetical protein
MEVWCALVVILGMAVWGSGSRTAILAAVVGLAVVEAGNVPAAGFDFWVCLILDISGLLQWVATASRAVTTAD